MTFKMSRKNYHDAAQKLKDMTDIHRNNMSYRVREKHINKELLQSL